MEWSKLLKHIHEGENATVQFISKVDEEDDIFPSIIGMLNAKGGLVFVGLSTRTFHLNGTTIDSTWLHEKITQHCSPQFVLNCDTVIRNDKKILVVHVPLGNNKPYTYKRKSYIREDKGVRFSTLEEERLMRDSNPRLVKYINSPEETSAILPPKSTEPKIKKAPIKIEAPAQVQASHSALSSPVLVDSPAIEKTGIHHRQTQALEYLQHNAKIQNKEYRQLYNVSHKTAHIELVDLVNRGYIVQKGSGRNTCYQLDPITPKQTTLSFGENSNIYPFRP